jgi:hypothetical protein
MYANRNTIGGFDLSSGEYKVQELSKQHNNILPHLYHLELYHKMGA